MRSTPPDHPLPTDAAPGSRNLLIRPSRPSDIEDFYELAELAGAGFTSLPANETLLAERLSASAHAFDGEHGVLMLALEDLAKRRVIGCAAVKPGGPPRADFLNFQVDHERGELTPTSRYADMTEVGSLLLHPDYRSGGIGPWLSRSRYLLIATDLDRFGSHIFSELRGVVDDDDRSPFYEAVCARHFDCSFAEADDHCAHGRQGALNALLPEAPIGLHALDADAEAAMGRPHRAGRRALDYLEAEGFRSEGIVDLLDGGPAVVAATRSIKTIRESLEAQLRPSPIDDDLATEAYIAVGAGSNFRCFRTRIAMDDDGALRCSSETFMTLEMQPDIMARIRPVDDGFHTVRDLAPPAAHARQHARLGTVVD